MNKLKKQILKQIHLKLGLNDNPNFFFNLYLYSHNNTNKMNKKYKISKGYLREFFGLFGKKKEDRTKKINNLIDNDPILKKLDKDIEALNKRATDRIKLTDPDFVDILKKHGVDIK